MYAATLQNMACSWDNVIAARCYIGKQAVLSTDEYSFDLMQQDCVELDTHICVLALKR